MSPKLKRWIIGSVVILIVALGGLGAFSVLSKLSTTTVYNISFVEVDSDTKIFSKEVYMTANDNNNFNVDLKVSATSLTNLVVESSDESVAKVSAVDGHYVVSYFKVGNATIKAYVSTNKDIYDSFSLKVQENYPMNFKITDENRVSDNEVKIFADNREYAFDFKATSINSNNPVNNQTLSVVDDYDKTIFDSISIDPATSKLLIKAKQSVSSSTEYITINCRAESGSNAFLTNFTVKIDVAGNYISDMQLVLSTSPNFNGTTYICGTGLLNEGEKRIDKEDLIFTNNVNIIYAQVRVVYTNSQMFYVTKKVSASGNAEGNTIKPPPSENYYQIKINNPTTINFYYNTNDSANPQEKEQSFTFYYKAVGTSEYEEFMDKDLYEKVIKEDGTTIYVYKHWDERYKRDDAVTIGGEIVGFKNGNPSCGV